MGIERFWLASISILVAGRQPHLGRIFLFSKELVHASYVLASSGRSHSFMG
jgi:hypothetical protein